MVNPRFDHPEPRLTTQQTTRARAGPGPLAAVPLHARAGFADKPERRSLAQTLLWREWGRGPGEGGNSCPSPLVESCMLPQDAPGRHGPGRRKRAGPVRVRVGVEPEGGRRDSESGP